MDYAYQWWRHEQDLKMTPQELREELRNLEGNPQVIARRKQVQRDLPERLEQCRRRRTSQVAARPRRACCKFGTLAGSPRGADRDSARAAWRELSRRELAHRRSYGGAEVLTQVSGGKLRANDAAVIAHGRLPLPTSSFA